MINDRITLSNGVEVPMKALGTWLIDDAHVEDVVVRAISVGYRHIDTAQAYKNESGVGRGIKACGIPRDEIFVTSKVAAEHKNYEDAARSIDDSLRELGLDCIDLMLIHSPQPWADVNRSTDRYIEGNRAAWRALEDAYTAGKVRAIGVSNFKEQDIRYLWDPARIKPMVNQVLCHVSNTPAELIEYCRERGIVMEAYSPIAHGEILRNKKLAEMAEKYGVSVARLCIRYDLQLGMITIPKTRREAHLRENFDVSFVISDEDMETLKNFDRIKNYGSSSYFPVFSGTR